MRFLKIIQHNDIGLARIFFFFPTIAKGIIFRNVFFAAALSCFSIVVLFLFYFYPWTEPLEQCTLII